MRASKDLCPLRRAPGLILVAFIVCLISCATPLSAQRGAIVHPRNLGELVDRAGVIVRGHVVSARVEPHPDFSHLSTVVVTLHVEETLKGEGGGIFTFRQYVWDVRDQFDAAGYRKGREMLLLMNRPSAYGLSSPVGLMQGRFFIRRDAAGNRVALNGHGNAGLFRDLDQHLARRGIKLTPRSAALAREHRHGPLPLEDLKEMIRQLAGAT